MAVSKYSDKLDVTGFVNPDGERVLVILNRSKQNLSFSIREYSLGGTLSIEKNSICTICYKPEEN